MVPTAPISLCICTRHRPDDLRRCLQSACEGTVRPEQIVVSDDGDPGQTVDDVVEAFPDVLYLRGTRQGLSANRNTCIASSTAPWIQFVDDDVVIPGSFFSDAMAALAAKIGGPREILAGTQWDIRGDHSTQMFPGNADFWGFQRVVPTSDDYRSIVINATLFPRRLFEEAKFDPRLRYGCDEIDIARHAVALGYRIHFDPTLQVHHYPAPANRSEYAKLVDASRLYAAGKAHWVYERSWPRTFAYLVLAPPREVLANAKRRGWKGAVGAVRSLGLATRYAVLTLRGQ